MAHRFARHLLCGCASFLFTLFSVQALAASPSIGGWEPSKPIEYIVPAGAGAALDTAARVVKQALESEKLVRQPIVVVNKAGGGGALMIAYLDERSGDGTILATIAPTLLTSKITGLIKKTYSDFTPLAVLFNEYIVVAVRAGSPTKSAKDLVDRLKSSERGLSVGVAAALGNHVHIGIALPLKTAKVDLSRLHAVAYKSSTESITGMLSGDLDLVASTASNVVSLLQAGKLRVLAISSGKRLSGVLADVPTWKEQGINVELVATQGVMGPGGLAKEQIAFWERAFSGLQQSAEYRTLLERHYWTPNLLLHDEAVRYYDQQYAVWHEVLGDLGLNKQ